MKQVVLKRHNSFLDNYKNVGDIVKRTRPMTALQFDDFVSNKLNLFTTDAQFDFENTEFVIDKITKNIGPIKRIFAKPRVDLIDTMNIMSVETVKKIYSQTIDYSSQHVDTISNVYKDGSVKPNRLLSNEYRILYEIYENRCFCYGIDMIIRFIKMNLAELSNYLFLNQEEVNVNILERLNHEKYYLAIGKLHTSYIRDFTRSFEDVERLMDKLLFINATIQARLHSTVYVRCKNAKRHRAPRRLQLKKTNIFRNEKDYKRIYDLMRYLLINYDILFETQLSPTETLKLVEPYHTYAKLLTLFAILHFNFEIQGRAKLNLKKLAFNAKFKYYKLSLKERCIQKIKFLVLEIKKEKKRRIVIYNSVGEDVRKQNLGIIKKHVKADEYYVFSPFIGSADATYININNVDSFRRIQQILLREMVYADSKHNICPFCGEKLTKRKGEKNSYECMKCHTVIKKKTCPKTKKSYWSTTINNYKAFLDTLSTKNRKAYLSTKNIESNMYYRNIQKYNYNMEEECPYCGEVHSDL